MPVPHSTLIDLIENNLTSRGFGIMNSEFAIQEGKLDGKALVGAKLFATLTLKHQTHDDFAFALGLRAANDKSMAIELVAGCTKLLSLAVGHPWSARKPYLQRRTATGHRGQFHDCAML